MSIEPLETELGRKRKINQSSCNKDFSCTEGFCPSFVTVEGGTLRKSVAPAATAVIDPRAVADQAAQSAFAMLPEPQISRIDRSFSILVAGIGGTGVVTIGQTLAVAAHLEGYFSSNLDVTGLAQKYGAVLSHVKIAPDPALLHATRVAAGECDTLIGCDLIVSAGDETVGKLRPGSSGGVICTDMVPTSEFSRNPDWNPDADALVTRLTSALGERGLGLEALRLAGALMGDAITANMFLLGAAWQRGLVPLSMAALDRAIELNGVAVDSNRRAFLWGRRAAHDLTALEKIAVGTTTQAVQVVRFDPRKPATLAQSLAHRTAFLADYQDADYARRYSDFIDRVVQAETAAGLGDSLSRAVARNLFKLMAHKDEWEVARLYARPEFKADLQRTFEGDFKLRFHVAGGPFGRRDPATGRLVKREVGPWLMTAFRMMAPLRTLRGSLLDPFRKSDERRLARELLDGYRADIERLLPELTSANHALAVRIASLPDKVRGYGHVRQTSATAVGTERDRLLAQWRQPQAPAETAWATELAR
jgi:indolepyruvate ferredoxin oxidoreductase